MFLICNSNNRNIRKFFEMSKIEPRIFQRIASCIIDYLPSNGYRLLDNVGLVKFYVKKKNIKWDR